MCLKTLDCSKQAWPNGIGRSLISWFYHVARTGHIVVLCLFVDHCLVDDKHIPNARAVTEPGL